METVFQRINGVVVPLLILGDPAYPLLSWLMKPFSDTGSLTKLGQDGGRKCFWQIQRSMEVLAKRMDYYVIQYTVDVVATCTVLHNICERNGDRCDPEWIHQDSQTTVSGNNIHNAIKQYVFEHQ